MLQYTLETFAESRSTCWAYEPYKGGYWLAETEHIVYLLPNILKKKKSLHGKRDLSEGGRETIRA